MPIFGHSPLLLAISALVFGIAFFAVVGSTTAFVRFNYPPQAWPTAIAALTIAFGIGQTLGPTAVGDLYVAKSECGVTATATTKVPQPLAIHAPVTSDPGAHPDRAAA